MSKSRTAFSLATTENTSQATELPNTSNHFIANFASLQPTQQLQYGGIAVATILAVTLLIRSLTELVKACNRN
jgi:hypothetical protein